MTIQNHDGSLSDAKRLLAALNFIVNEVLEDGDSHQELLFGLIHAIGDKNDTASKALRCAPRSDGTGRGG